MNVLGDILVLIGFMIYLFGDARFLVVAYHRSLLWYFGCVFIPFAGLAFFLLNFRKTWRPVVVSTFGILIAVAGCWAGGF
jgi:hypothetical protein